MSFTTSGWLVVDKPVGCTSTYIGRLIKRQWKPQKIGHIGTLDPLASGVLVFSLNEATKFIPFWTQCVDKTYCFDVTFGEQRTTDDAEGDVIATSPLLPTMAQITAQLPHFIGTTEQMPPIYSAIQVAGQRAYDMARKGYVPQLSKRTVQIEGLHYVEQCNETTHRLRVHCKSGLYVRALARDLAHMLGTVGYVSYLRREKDGPFTANDGITLEKLQEIHHDSVNIFSLSYPLAHIPDITLVSPTLEKFCQGQYVFHPHIDAMPDSHIWRIYGNGCFQGMATRFQGMLKPKRLLFNPFMEVSCP